MAAPILTTAFHLAGVVNPPVQLAAASMDKMIEQVADPEPHGPQAPTPFG